jgi:hypothetical protein
VGGFYASNDNTSTDFFLLLSTKYGPGVVVEIVEALLLPL